MTYNPSKSKVHAVLKDQAKSDDILKAAFHVRYMAVFQLYSKVGEFLFWKVLKI